MAGGRGRGDDYARAAPADGRVCARKEPAEAREQDLFAKALALQDGEGHRVVILTADLIGIIDRLRETWPGGSRSSTGCRRTPC